MKRIKSLDFLRFFAALIVIMFHYGENTQLAQSASPLITAGPQILSIFFVLTGFVLMVAYFHKENISISNFYMTRFARIAPVYWIALALIIHWTYSATSTMNGWRAALLNVTFLQAWFPPYPLSLNYPSWALSVEVFFYLIFPFILWAIKKSNISWKNLAILALLIYFITQTILNTFLRSGFYTGFPSVSHDLMFYFPLVHFCSFFLGISGGYIYVRNMDRFNQHGIIPPLLFILSLLLNFYLLQFPESLPRIAGVPLVFGASFYSLPLLLLILSLAYSSNIITRALSLPILVFLGEISYSLYIFQLPFHIYYTGHISNYLTVNLGMSQDVDFYVFLFLLILVAIISYYLIEKTAKKIILGFYQKMNTRKKLTIQPQ